MTVFFRILLVQKVPALRAVENIILLLKFLRQFLHRDDYTFDPEHFPFHIKYFRGQIPALFLIRMLLLKRYNLIFDVVHDIKILVHCRKQDVEGDIDFQIVLFVFYDFGDIDEFIKDPVMKGDDDILHDAYIHRMRLKCLLIYDMADQKLVILIVEIGRPVIFNHFIFELYISKPEIIDQLLLIPETVIVIPRECHITRHIPAAGRFFYSVIFRYVLYGKTHLITPLSLIPEFSDVKPKKAVKP